MVQKRAEQIYYFPLKPLFLLKDESLINHKIT